MNMRTGKQGFFLSWQQELRDSAFQGIFGRWKDV
jgi:hypothetical protein